MYYPSIERLILQIESLLDQHRVGLSEHELIKHLREEEDSALPHGQLAEPLTLFQTHFLLFHALYLLRARLWQKQQAHLEISPLNIKLQAYTAGKAELEPVDPLRDYYLELDNLAETEAQDVEALLTAFWMQLNSKDARREALAELGLSDPVDFKTIKVTYRQLAMKHHPDRGGDKSRLQSINAAMNWLARNTISP